MGAGVWMYLLRRCDTRIPLCLVLMAQARVVLRFRCAVKYHGTKAHYQTCYAPPNGACMAMKPNTCCLSCRCRTGREEMEEGVYGLCMS